MLLFYDMLFSVPFIPCWHLKIHSQEKYNKNNALSRMEENPFFPSENSSQHLKFYRQVKEHKGLAKHNVIDLDFIVACVVPSPS